MPQRIKKKTKKFTFQCYREIGISRFIFNLKKDEGYIEKNITLIVNPKILLEDYHLCYSTIVDPDRVAEVTDKLLAFLNELSSEIKIYPSDISISRIDYCTNFWFCNQNTAEEYMMILERFRPKKPEKQKLFPHPTKHRREARDSEITLCGASYEFSIYAKHIQIGHYRDTTMDLNNEDDYKNSEGQIRIEYRAGKPALNRMRRKMVPDYIGLLTTGFESPTKKIIKQLHSLYGKGDFYKKRIAIKIIKNSVFGEKVQSKMIDIIEKVSKARSLNPDYNHIDRSTLSRYITQYFNKINLSPIVIPKEWNQSYFPNPAKYIEGTSSYLLRDSVEAASVTETEPDIECGLQRNNEAPEP